MTISGIYIMLMISAIVYGSADGPRDVFKNSLCIS